MGSVGAAIGDHHIGDGYIGGGSKKAEGCGRERIVGPNGFEYDSDLDGERDSLEQELPEHGERECNGGVRECEQTQSEDTADNAVAQIEEAQWQAPGEDGKKSTANDSWNEGSQAASEADGAGGGVKVGAKAS